MTMLITLSWRVVVILGREDVSYLDTVIP